ncbi:MAG: hypothetical protein KDA28_08950 [Phycisphaerales bacterium]|nr:hypothetical protein [Phycisphaerales bacterium]
MNRFADTSAVGQISPWNPLSVWAGKRSLDNVRMQSRKLVGVIELARAQRPSPMQMATTAPRVRVPGALDFYA